VGSTAFTGTTLGAALLTSLTKSVQPEHVQHMPQHMFEMKAYAKAWRAYLKIA
jgi:hypothetical protein